MKYVGILARVSTTGGRQDYERQVNDLTQVILSQNYGTEQIITFTEEISGFTKNSERPELQRLIKYVEDGKIEKIFVTEISRVGRNPSETRRTIDLFTDLGIPIYIQSMGRSTIDENGKRDGLINTLLQFMMEQANIEAEQTKSRSRSGLLNSARKGRAGGGLLHNYGYSKGIDKMLVVDEEEAQVVKEIYQMYLDGLGSKAISTILQQKGIPTKYNRVYGDKIIKNTAPKEANKVKWTDVSVLNILTNPIYKGERIFKGETIKCPAIISTEIWEECQRIRNTKTHRNYLTSYTYLLKDIIKCGCCGRNYFAKYKPVKNGDKVYKCSSTLLKNGSCGNKGINISLLESAIYDQLIKSDAVLKYFTDVKAIRKKLELEIKQIKTTIEKETLSINENETKKKKLLDIYLSLDTLTKEEFTLKNEEIIKSIENSQSRVIQLSKQLLETERSLNKENSSGTTRTMLLNAKDDRKKLEVLFKQVIKKVIVNDLSVNKIMASIFIQVNGVELPIPLKLILDKFSIRKNYKYLSIKSMENEPVYKDGVLLVEKDDILEEVENGWYKSDWCEIKDDRILFVS